MKTSPGRERGLPSSFSFKMNSLMSNHKNKPSPNGKRQHKSSTRTYSIPDYRLEVPDYIVRQVRSGDEFRYEVEGDLNTPVPPIRDSNYLSKQQCIEIYRYMVSPISMLGDLIPVLSGVALGARLQGRNIAVMTYIGDGGQSTGVTYEGINFAAVQNLGLVLFIESNLWAYSTPSEMQYRVKDLAERAIGYGIPGVIIDGTDACQVYDAAREAVERAHGGEGPTLIEAKMMRMKGHAIYDAADYVPKPLFDYWKKRDPITSFENYLVRENKWLSAKENADLIAEVERVIEEEREIAVNSPMPTPESAEGGVYCEDGCHVIKPKYGLPKVRTTKSSAGPKQTEAAVHLK